MTTPKQYLGRKAMKATVRHSMRGTTAKARRKPPRTLTLLGVGAVLGAVGGWLLARRPGEPSDAFTAYRTPTATQSTPEAKAAAPA